MVFRPEGREPPESESSHSPPHLPQPPRSATALSLPHRAAHEARPLHHLHHGNNSGAAVLSTLPGASIFKSIFFEKESPFSSMWLSSSWKHFPVSDCFSATQMSQGLTCLSVATHAVPSAWNASFPSLVPPACFLFILHSRLKSNSPRKPSLTLRLFSLPTITILIAPFTSSVVFIMVIVNYVCLVHRCICMA